MQISECVNIQTRDPWCDDGNLQFACEFSLFFQHSLLHCTVLWWCIFQLANIEDVVVAVNMRLLSSEFTVPRAAANHGKLCLFGSRAFVDLQTLLAFALLHQNGYLFLVIRWYLSFCVWLQGGEKRCAIAHVVQFGLGSRIFSYFFIVANYRLMQDAADRPLPISAYVCTIAL